MFKFTYGKKNSTLNEHYNNMMYRKKNFKKKNTNKGRKIISNYSWRSVAKGKLMVMGWCKSGNSLGSNELGGVRLDWWCWWMNW